MENIIAFFAEWWQYLAIVGGTIFLIVLAFIIFTAIERRAAVKSRQVRHVEPQPEPEPVEEPVEPLLPESTPLTPAEPLPASGTDPIATPATEMMPDPALAPLQPVLETTVSADLTATAETTAEPIPEALPVTFEEPVSDSVEIKGPPKPAKPVAPKPVLGKYHVLYRPEDGKWYVKREGSQKVMKVLETQTDAINWTTIRALTQDIGMIVHKKDGKIRKMP